MSVNNIDELGITVGYACNFNCAHCGVAHKKNLRLSESEIKGLVRTINSNRIPSLLFVGGEPTLYIDDINGILRRVKTLKDTKIRITTNGHFADSIHAARIILGKFVRVDRVMLSYDKFHKKFIHDSHIRNLAGACADLGIEFGVLMAIQSPMDLTLIPALRRIGEFPIGIQKVLPTGAAKDAKVAIAHTVFNRGVLRRRCPNVRKMMYLCGEGYSLCCSSLVLNGDAEGFIHPTLYKHVNSKFHRIISSKTFGEIMRINGITVAELSPEHSEPCSLCEYIFKTRRGGIS